MYSLLKGYVVRKPADEDSSDEVNKEDRSQVVIRSPRSQQQNNSQSSSYGRLLSWGFEGVSYLGGQVKQRVERSLLWVSSESEPEVKEENAIIMPRRNRKPEGSLEYSVGSSDTLAKIALKYNITPSELARMNRLPSHMLYPGQVLYVPEKIPSEEDCVKDAPQEKSGKPEVTFQHSLEGQHEKIKLTNKVSLLSDEEEEIAETFLKINAKYITDGQGVVNGVMLVTPQSVIFSPNVSEPLVMDRGRDSYSIKTPMSAVTSAALFKDIAAMAVHDPLKTGRFYLDEATKESVSRQNSVEVDNQPNTSSPLNKPNKSANIEESSYTTPTKKDKNELNDSKTAKGLSEPMPSSIVDRGGNGVPKVVSHENEPQEIVQIVHGLLNDLISDVVAGVYNDKQTMNEHVQSSEDTLCSLEGTSHIDKDSLSPVSEDSGICSPQSKWNKRAKSGDQEDLKKGQEDTSKGFSVQSNKGHFESSDHDTSHDSVMDNLSTASSGDKKRSSSFLSSLSGEVKYWLGVGHRNQAADDHAYEEEIIPRPATTSYDDQLFYLCIRISKKHWCICLAGEGSHLQREEELMNRDRRRREYWFAIPVARVEHVYGFFKQYCPNINRTLNLSEEEDDDEDEPLEDEEEEAVQYVDCFYSCSPPNPKAVIPFTNIGKHLELQTNLQHTREGKESVLTPDSLCDDFSYLPEMSVESQILSEPLIKKLNKNLPSRLVGHIWTLVYSTFIHGFSIKTMYRIMEEFDTPMLIVVQDDQHQVFGTMTSCPLRLSEGFYGTGQSFLFKFEGEEIKTFAWRGDNDFFMKGSVDCIAFGSGGGHFGLWLDEDFYHGSSHFSETYHNETLSKNEDFLCSAVEAWTFM